MAKSWGNDPEKLFFIEGEDDIQNISEQPYIYIVKVPHHGDAQYEESVVLSVKVGNSTIFESVNFCVSLAAVIQLCFVFNFTYSDQADDIFNYIQRCLAKFRPISVAMDKKGQLRKKFLDFQCADAHLNL